ncbi:unnamed protein product, partial [Prorocentrum cordatum]
PRLCVAGLGAMGPRPATLGRPAEDPPARREEAPRLAGLARAVEDHVASFRPRTRDHSCPGALLACSRWEERRGELELEHLAGGGAPSAKPAADRARANRAARKRFFRLWFDELVFPRWWAVPGLLRPAAGLLLPDGRQPVRQPHRRRGREPPPRHQPAAHGLALLRRDGDVGGGRRAVPGQAVPARPPGLRAPGAGQAVLAALGVPRRADGGLPEPLLRDRAAAGAVLDDGVRDRVGRHRPALLLLLLEGLGDHPPARERGLGPAAPQGRDGGKLLHDDDPVAAPPAGLRLHRPAQGPAARGPCAAGGVASARCPEPAGPQRGPGRLHGRHRLPLAAAGRPQVVAREVRPGHLGRAGGGALRLPRAGAEGGPLLAPAAPAVPGPPRADHGLLDGDLRETGTKKPSTRADARQRTHQS